MIVCQRCKKTNRAGARYCVHCRYPISEGKARSSCSRGHRLDPTWESCPFCKTDHDPDAHRFPDDGDSAIARWHDNEGEAIEIANDKPAEVPPPIDPEQRISLMGVCFSFSFEQQGAAFPVRTGRNLIGSAANASIRARDPSVRAQHAILTAQPGYFAIEPIQRAAATFVNGKPINARTALGNGFVIQTGNTLWRFLTFVPPDPSARIPLR